MKKAFTLIELLTVIAITAVLMTLIVLPIFQSFNITRQAQAFADAQDKGRLLVERIAREVGNAVTIRGSAAVVTTTLNVRNIANGADNQTVDLPGGTLIIRVPGRPATPGAVGPVVETVISDAKLDLIPPTQGDPGDRQNGAFYDPVSGKYDPTLTRPKGDIRLPVAPGATIVRWWIGLKNPLADYNEPYTGLLMTRNGQGDNLYVLRRAEIQPYNSDGSVNTSFFRADPQNPRRILDLDDPRFFIADNSDAGKNVRVGNWAAASVVQTEISRYDMIRPVTTGQPAAAKVVYGTGDLFYQPQVLPLIQFRPTRVSSAPATASVAARPGEAVDGLDRIGPDTYQTERGLITNAVVRFYPGDFGSANPSGVEVAGVSITGESVIYQAQANANGLEDATTVALFNITAYERTAATNGFPFTAASGVNLTSTAELRRLFTPFRVVSGTGKIVTSFPIEDVGTTGPAAGVPNVPTVQFTSPAFTASQALTADATLGVAPLSPLGANNFDPNRAYNRIYNQYPELRGILQRFIDLRMVANPDGTPSPLFPGIQANAGFNFYKTAGDPTKGSVNRVRIVPGSETVYGPDQSAPAGQVASNVRYTRVTGQPGPNQYRLVYADLPEPTSEATNNVDYSVLGIPNQLFAGFDPNAYNEENVVSAMIQPRYKAGYLQLCSDPELPIPGAGTGTQTGKIMVSYRFQFNGPDDTVSVDYDTREIMQVLLTIKNYPQSTAPTAQTVTLKSTATLRNALR